MFLEHVTRTICKQGGHKYGSGPRQEWEDISVKSCHAAIKKLCTLSGVLVGSGGGQCAAIPGNYRPAKMGRRDRTPGHPVGDVAVIEPYCDAPSRAPQASIPHLWIFESTSKEEAGFPPGTSFQQ